MVKKHGEVHPAVYAFLPNKQRTTYLKMFELLKEMEPNLKPSLIVCDFEQAAHSAMNETFPDVQIKECFFHLAKNMQKHLARMGFTSLYNTDPDFLLKAEMVIATAFVSLNKIDEYLAVVAIELLQELEIYSTGLKIVMLVVGTYEEVEELLYFFLRFLLYFFRNLYQRTLNGENRTNNNPEAAHRRLKYKLGTHHSTIWKLIDGLRKVQKGRNAHYEKLLAGHQPPQKLKKYRDADRRIHETVLRFENMDPVEYLRNLAHNYEMN